MLHSKAKPRFSKYSLLLRTANQTLFFVRVFFHALYMARPPHPTLFKVWNKHVSEFRIVIFSSPRHEIQ
jgi:hypothetical protein